MIDNQLIEQCGKGLKSAQKALYKAYAQKMFMHCYRYVKNKEDAEEILSDGFLKVFRSINQLEGKDQPTFEAWMRKIMVNECLMFLRKKKHLFFSEEKAYAAESSLNLEGILEGEDIYKLILALPIGYRTIFNLFAIEGYTHQEIAHKLQINESTSRSQLTKARSLLKSLLVNKGIKP